MSQQVTVSKPSIKVLYQAEWKEKKTLWNAGLCRGCVLGTFSTLKSGMFPIILAVGANVPTYLRFMNGNITEVTPEKLPMSPYVSMVWVICPHFSKTLAEHWKCDMIHIFWIIYYIIYMISYMIHQLRIHYVGKALRRLSAWDPGCGGPSTPIRVGHPWAARCAALVQRFSQWPVKKYFFSNRCKSQNKHQNWILQLETNKSSGRTTEFHRV